MLTNAYLLAKIGADTAENEQHFAEILPKTGNYLANRPSGRRSPGGHPVPKCAVPDGSNRGALQGRAGTRARATTSRGISCTYGKL